MHHNLAPVTLTVISIMLSACGGGAASTSVNAPTQQAAAGVVVLPAAAAVVDNRYNFQPFAYNYNLPTGITTVSYRLGDFKSAAEFAKTEHYKIEDYGFFEATVKGLNNGCPRSECGEEYAAPGPWNHRPYHITESDINGDGHKDFYLFEWIHNSRADAPDDLIHAFINDGNGHFKLSNDTVFDTGKACTSSGAEWPAQNGGAAGALPKDRNSECGYQLGVVRHVLVADFNNDGMDDIFGGMVLQLSNNGKLYNKTLTHLPDYFRHDYMQPLFTHDQYAGDATGDGNIDIFMPAKLSAIPGYWLDGSNIDGCAECVASAPWSLLVNDGTGNFSINQNFPIMGVGAEHPIAKQYMPHNDPNKGILWGGNIEDLWVTTTAIADFDLDGHPDIVVGWFNPRATELWDLGVNSAGAVYFNDGNNDWRNRPIVSLPASFYNSNGNANDMEVMDFDEDGWPDIILASTKQAPYYDGRVIQFFRNNRDGTFSDVTDAVHPEVKHYADGTGTPLWNGEGLIQLIDFNGDGKLDIVDSSSRTYVLLNNGAGNFTMYKSTNFPVTTGSDSTYFPVNSNGTYGFIGYRNSCAGDSCTTSYFQVKQ